APIRSRGGSEAVGEAGDRIVARFLLGERTARRVALQAPALDAADHRPARVDVVRAEQAGAGEEQAARGIEAGLPVIPAHRFAIGPGRLPEDPGLEGAVPVHTDGRAQIRLRAAVAAHLRAHARKQQDRRRAELRLPFRVHAVGSAGAEVGHVALAQQARLARLAAFLVRELRAEREPGAELRVRAAFEHALHGAREEQAAVVVEDRHDVDVRDVGLPVTVPGDAGQSLHGWWVAAAAWDAKAVLYLHGNDGNVSTSMGEIAPLRELGYAVFMPDYRGYGESEGPFPSEKTV